jgi:4-hydroxy-tetrahydrodipicolinate reductase
MGRAAIAAILEDADLELVAAVARSKAGKLLADAIGQVTGDIVLSDRLEALVEARAEVAVDFTLTDLAVPHAKWLLKHGIHAVIGTTGIPPEGIEEIRAATIGARANAIVAPDFSMSGAVMLHIARIAARYLPELELFESHNPSKADSPSGTTVNTARELARVRARIAAPASQSREVIPGARGGLVDGVRVHSLRLSGAAGGTEEIRFAQPGETLSISCTAHSLRAFATGAILAIKEVGSRSGFTNGMHELMGLSSD